MNVVCKISFFFRVKMDTYINKRVFRFAGKGAIQTDTVLMNHRWILLHEQWNMPISTGNSFL